MHRVTIQYAVPEDPAAFDQRYFDQHVPLVATIPGLRAFSWSKPRPIGWATVVYLVAQLDFEDDDLHEGRSGLDLRCRLPGRMRRRSAYR